MLERKTILDNHVESSVHCQSLDVQQRFVPSRTRFVSAQSPYNEDIRSTHQYNQVVSASSCPKEFVMRKKDRGP